MKRSMMILVVLFSLMTIACELKDDEEQTNRCDAMCNLILKNYFNHCDASPEEPMCADTISGMVLILNECRDSCGSDSAM